MMFLRFYLFVGAYSDTHEVHETFDLDHGTSTEPLENHENVLHNAAHPEQQDVYNYEMDTHNLHEQLHDGSDFVIEDHVEHPATWNFMEDANKNAEEAGESPPGTRQGQAGGRQRAITGPSIRGPPPTFAGSSSFPSPTFRSPQARTGGSGLACTNDAAKATLMANQLIGMLFRSSQMMSDIVNMFTIPNPAASRASRPGQFQGGNPGFNSGGFNNGGFNNGGFNNGGLNSGGLNSGGFPSGGFPSGGFPSGGFPSGGFNNRGSGGYSGRAASSSPRQISPSPAGIAAAMTGMPSAGMRMGSHGAR